MIIIIVIVNVFIIITSFVTLITIIINIVIVIVIVILLGAIIDRDRTCRSVIHAGSRYRNFATPQVVA